jgi:glyoxylase-like metal-dependent hydrolase (beta-lactamase superfamily II)
MNVRSKTYRPMRSATLMLCMALCSGVMAQDSKVNRIADPNPKNAVAIAVAARAEVARENPLLMRVIMRGGAFSGEVFSRAIANNMYSRTDAAAIADARAMLKVEAQGPRTWLLRMPFVNIVVFETDEGLVLVDSGYAPAGPALRETLKSLSSKPVHTIFHTHLHADHAWGAWTLMDMGPGGKPPRIVTTETFVDQMNLDLQSHGLIARNNQQISVPRSWDDVLRPSLTFHRQVTLNIGGEDFIATHARGETEDQLWVWAPSRRVVASADYYQDFMPNTGNGKRRQRFAEEWAQALTQMAAHKPLRVLPAHGAAIVKEAEIQDKLGAHAKALNMISEQVLQGLNAGQRVDQVIEQVKLPADLAHRHDLREDYVTAKDIGRMVVKQYGGWWDDVPSHWNPAPLSEQGREIAALAGGPRALVLRAKDLVKTSPALAASLADWAWLAAPDDAVVLQGSLDVYNGRVRDDTTTQEALVYMEHMIRLKRRLAELKGK